MAKNSATQAAAASQYHRRATQEKFRRRKKSLVRRVHEMKTLCDAEAYLVLYRSGKYFVYKSTTDPNFPPTEADMEKVSVGVPEKVGPADFAASDDAALLFEIDEPPDLSLRDDSPESSMFGLKALFNLKGTNEQVTPSVGVRP